MFQPLSGGFYASAGSLVGTQAVLAIPTPPPPAQLHHNHLQQQLQHHGNNNGHHSLMPSSATSLTMGNNHSNSSSHSHPPPVMVSRPPLLPKAKSRSSRDKNSEISCCLKYLIFGSNVLFWVFGLVVTLVGVWAWTEKDIFNNFSRISYLALDPAFVLIVGGSLGFVIGLTGCFGALREHTCLLAGYAIFLAILLLAEMSAGILGFIFKDWIKAQATNGFQAFIITYRDDPDRQNLIDWIQEQWLECCGIEGPKDWDMNIYFNCSSVAQGSREACGVPFSCCRFGGQDELSLIRNKQCGYDVRKSDYAGDKSAVIYEKGCLRAGEEWIEANLIPVAAATVVVAVLQILGICFAQNLRADIFAQRAKWH